MKSNKKLTVISTTAMALSLFAALTLVQPASAAVKTSADFTDLAGSNATLKTKIDRMIADGIFEGVSGTTFGISQNMTRAQFAKVATKIYNIPVDLTINVSSFTDVHADDAANGWAIPYIEAAKKAGLIDGVTDTTFQPGESVTAAQLDTVLLKGLGKTVSMTGSPWYTDAVKQATALGIHPTSKAGDQAATREDLVLSSYGAQDAFKAQNLPIVSPSNPSNVSIVGDYHLASVIDSGLTSSATGIITKTIAEDPTQSKFAKEIKIKVTSSAGEEIAIPGIVQSVVSTDPSIAKVGLTSDHRAYVLGNKAGTTDVSVIVQVGTGEAKQLHVSVTVQSDPVSVKTLTVGETSFTEPMAIDVADSVYKANFNAYTAMDLTATDSYGNTYKGLDIPNYNFALGTLFITNDVRGEAGSTVGSVSVDSDGTVHVTGNVTYFELTAVSATGVKVTSYVTLTK
ncbi:S-layer homology domain-containing protein [Paenibacillus sp. LjRoot153]|uniref:S-layer homology domain-containing protein n=1 Tax=Paenibacillus sp. LjRoot153 TaxID=3342270 RepID=UPI003ECF7BE9